MNLGRNLPTVMTPKRTYRVGVLKLKEKDREGFL